MKNTYFIVTIHNKESLIKRVLEGVILSAKSSKHNTTIVCVFDGCTDRSEEIADEYLSQFESELWFRYYKIHQPDVHELLSLNSAFKLIDELESDPESLIYLLQDDVILEEPQLSQLIDILHEMTPNLGYISFRCGLATSLDANNILCEHTFLESEYGHWKQLNLDHFVEVGNKEFGICEIVIKSPTCIKKGVLDKVGHFDPQLAPFGHDDLDLCIRLNKLGYQNAIFGAKFTSKLDWGGTREPENQESEYHKRYNEIIHRNKLYLTKKHEDYYKAKTGSH